MWKDWFYYSRRERNGIVVLLIILMLLLIARMFMPDLVKHEKFDYSIYQAKIDSFKQALYNDSVFTARLKEDEFVRDSLYKFDPNEVDSFKMRQLGFGSVSINNIKRYRNAGGVFKKAEDLGRIYSISEKELNQLSPFISIVSTDGPKRKQKYEPANDKVKEKPEIIKVVESHKPAILIEMNSADTALLKVLPGIGDVFSERIIKYRDWLGGFYSLDQLNEVYGLRPELILSLSDQLEIDTTLLEKLYINEISVNQMKGHPYLDFYQARAIYDYRKNVKSIDDFQELLTIKALDTVNLERLEPYLSFSSSGTKE